MSNQIDQNFDEPVDVEGAARILKLKKSTIYQLTHQRRLRFFRAHGKVYFRRQDLLDYVFNADNAVLSRGEIEDKANQQLLREQQNVEN